MRFTLGLLLLASAGCDDTSALPLSDAAPQDLSAVHDGLADDLPARVDAAPDLALPDAAAPTDGDTPDQAGGDGATDGATPDLPPPCKGGYLNGGGCPLGCDPAVNPVMDEGAFHVPYCEYVQYLNNPPASGQHWPWHPEWGVSDQVVQREYWVHSLEHGAVMLLYNCPPGPDGGVGPTPDGGAGPYECDGGVPPPPNNCAKDIQSLVKLFQAQKPDKFGVVRIVVTPDPKLPKKFAAVAWNWSYLSDVVDTKALQCFIDARYGFGPEDAP